MPEYKITGPNGRTVKITGPSMPTEQEMDEIFAAAPPVAEPVAQPAEPSLASSILGRGMDIVQRVGNTLGRGGAAVAGIAKEGVEAYQQGQPLGEMAGEMVGAVKDTFTPTGVGTFKRTTDFDDVLNTAGMEEGWTRAGLGLAGDVMLDPLMIGGVAKGVSKGITGAAKVAGKVADVTPGIKQVKSAVQNTFAEPKFDEFVNTVEGSATKGLDYGGMKRLHESQRRSVSEHAEDFSKTFFKDYLKDDTSRTKLAHAIDQGVSTGDANLDALIPQWKSKMDELWDTQVGMGLVDPANKRANYIQYLTKSGKPVDAVVGAEASATTRASKKRAVFETLEDAKQFGGATDDAGQILGASIADVGKAQRTQTFLEDVKTAFGSDTAGPNMRKLNPGTLKIGKGLKAQLENTYLPARIADDLERATVLWEKPTELDGLYKTGMKIWKSMATSINPGHHVTNLMGNIHNMYIGGMKGAEIGPAYIQARKIAKNKSAEFYPEIPGYSKQDLHKWANEYEIVGTSGMLGEMAESGTHKIVNNPAFKYGREFGTQKVEEPARLAFWLSEIRKGKTPAEAALRTKDVLFDYSELTKTEKTIRDSGVVPFYTWMRKNIPLQLKAIGDNPRAVEAVSNIGNVPWNANQTQVNESIIPHNSQHAGYVPGPMTGPNGEMVMQRVNMPNIDLNKAASLSTITDSLGPLPKLVIEGGTGQKFFGGPVQTTTGLSSPAPAAAMLKPLNYLLPDSMEGYITPKTDSAGRERQNDVMAWLMNTLIPTGIYGSTAKVLQGEADPNRPEADPLGTTIARFTGTSADVLSASDQKFELMDRKRALKRELVRKALLEK